MPSAKRPKAVEAWAIVIAGRTIVPGHCARHRNTLVRIAEGTADLKIIRVRIIPVPPKPKRRAARRKA